MAFLFCLGRRLRYPSGKCIVIGIWYELVNYWLFTFYRCKFLIFCILWYSFSILLLWFFFSERVWSCGEVVQIGAVRERRFAEYHTSPASELEFRCRHSEQNDQSRNAATSCRHSGYVANNFFTYRFISLIDVKNGSDEIFSCTS